MKRVIALILLLRPKQWSKNLFVFGALIFTRSFQDVGTVLTALQAFAAMCALSSATYAANDALDAERDRHHPKKKNRPVASGLIPVPFALALSVVLLLGGSATLANISSGSMFCGFTYVMLQVAYNAGLKHRAIADVFTIAAGFVLRAVLGAVAISAQISGWLLFCTAGLALLLGFAKRRHEFLAQGQNSLSREALKGYNKMALDAMVVMSACFSVLFYTVYSIESSTATQYPGIIITTPFVTYAVFRYVFLVLARDEGGEPESLVVTDKHIVASVGGYLITVYLALTGLTLPFLGPTIGGKP